MDIRKIMRQCFLEYGYAKGILTLTQNEYNCLVEDTRIEWNMTPEEYLASRGLNIEIQVI